MDREKAIDRLKAIKTVYALTPTANESIDFAIEALGREIEYGQMVVDFTKGETMKSDEWKYDTTCVAESATTTDCNDCIWSTCNYNKIDWEVSEDCISREWLINHFKDMVEHYEMRIKRVKRHGEKTTYDTSKQISYWKDEIADYKYFIREIENAPSVIPTERTEEWILDDGTPICSACHKEPCWSSEGYDFTDFCPNCGAKMKG